MYLYCKIERCSQIFYIKISREAGVLHYTQLTTEIPEKSVPLDVEGYNDVVDYLHCSVLQVKLEDIIPISKLEYLARCIIEDKYYKITEVDGDIYGWYKVPFHIKVTEELGKIVVVTAEAHSRVSAPFCLEDYTLEKCTKLEFLAECI